jgi:hypothetical protein
LPPTATSAVFDISFLTRRCALLLFALASRSSPNPRVVSRRGRAGSKTLEIHKRLLDQYPPTLLTNSEGLFSALFSTPPWRRRDPPRRVRISRSLVRQSGGVLNICCSQGPPPPIPRAWSTSGEQRRAKGEQRLVYLTSSNTGSRTASYSGTRVHFISSSMIAFCACSRFSACWNTNEREQSMTSSVTSSPR